MSTLKFKVFRGLDKRAAFSSDIDAIEYAKHRSECDPNETVRWTVVYWPKKREHRIFVDGKMVPQDQEGTWDPKAHRN